MEPAIELFNESFHLAHRFHFQFPRGSTVPRGIPYGERHREEEGGQDRDPEGLIAKEALLLGGTGHTVKAGVHQRQEVVPVRALGEKVPREGQEAQGALEEHQQVALLRVAGVGVPGGAALGALALQLETAVVHPSRLNGLVDGVPAPELPRPIAEQPRRAERPGAQQVPGEGTVARRRQRQEEKEGARRQAEGGDLRPFPSGRPGGEILGVDIGVLVDPAAKGDALGLGIGGHGTSMILSTTFTMRIRSRLSLALAALWVLPLWVVAFPPMVDYPQQLALAAILRWYSDPARRFRETYELALWTPHGLFKLLAAGLAWAMPIEVAGKLIVSASLLAVGAAALALCRGTGAPGWYALLALALTYNSIFYWGFVDNLLAFPLALAGAALADRLLDGPFGARPWLALAATCLLFYTVHLQFLLLFAGAVG